MGKGRDPSDLMRPQTRTLATSLALVATLGATWRCSFSFVTRLLFPSGDVTLAKILWLLLGLGLASVHLRDVVDTWRHQWYWVDEFTSKTISGSSLSVLTRYFQGHVSIDVNRKSCRVQVQGRFTRSVPMNSNVLVALELPQEKLLTWGGKLLFAIVQRCCNKNGVHVSRGESKSDGEDAELRRIAIPLRSFGHSHHGEGRERSEVKGFVVGKMYTLEAGVEDWRWTLLFVVATWLPVWWTGIPLVRLAGYLATPPSSRDNQSANKRHLFSFVMREGLPNARAQELRISLPKDGQVSGFDVGSPIAMWSANGQRGGGVPVAHVEACRRIGEDAHALGQLNFSLDVWVEFVDRVAGRRKVGYLMEVVDMPRQRRRTVMRSAKTVKNALLLLRLEHQLDRKETERETGITEVEHPDAEQIDEPIDFQHLSVESREYRYQQIEHETSAVAHVLDQVASKPSQGRRRWRQPQHCYQNQLEKATLYRCLMSPSRLPSVPSYHGIGVQINESQHLAMNVVCEAGVYRLHGAGDGTTPLLRQEWFIVSADHLHFFRSFSVAPSLSIPVTHVLTISSVDRVGLLQGNHPASVHHEEGSVPRWYCVEIHLVFEVITLFVETSEERGRLVASLQPLTIDNCDVNGTVPAKAAKSEAVAASPLFTPMDLNSQNQPVCLNQRTSRFVDNQSIEIDASAMLQASLEAGLKVFALGETASRLRISRAKILRFLGTVEKLNGLDLEKVASEMPNEARVALGLNLYHTLFIHSVLVFGYPQSHEQWKLLQTVPCYLVRTNNGVESVRFTLADIQRVILRCPVPVTLEASSLKRSLSQNALMDLAIGGGDAINGLCRTMLGVAWTPVLPCSSSYSAIKKTPLPIPAGLSIDGTDIRMSMVLQINSSPPIAKTTGIMRVYDGGGKLNEQINSVCTTFLSRELRLNEVNRVIYLPRVCEWYQIGHRDEDGDDQNDGINRGMGPLSQHCRRRSSSGSIGGLAALPKSRSFYCLQRLLGFMEVEQHHRVMHLLLGAGEECKFVFDDFWTRPSRSTAASLLSSAGTAALSVFTSSTTNGVTGAASQDTNATKRDRDWFNVGQQGLRSYF